MQSCRDLPRFRGSKTIKGVYLSFMTHKAYMYEKRVCLSTGSQKENRHEVACLSNGSHKASIHEVSCLSTRCHKTSIHEKGIPKHWVSQGKHARERFT